MWFPSRSQLHEMCSARLKYWAVAPLIATSLTTTATHYNSLQLVFADVQLDFPHPRHLSVWVKIFSHLIFDGFDAVFLSCNLYLNSTSLYIFKISTSRSDQQLLTHPESTNGHGVRLHNRDLPTTPMPFESHRDMDTRSPLRESHTPQPGRLPL